jgi:uncharacterized protein (TIGR02145 family)/prepilin-type N-terminal cleavage/methylation domain-containing protein
MKQKQKAFTLIELLVVIAIIGILATLAVVALQQARQNARDAKRVADVKQLSTALELYFNDNQSYPETIDDLQTGGYMEQLPEAPTPADEDCSPEENEYVYTVDAERGDYEISFCVGKQVSDMSPGVLCMTPGGLTTNCESVLDGGEEDFSGTSGTFTDSRDSQVYNWVRIGGQVWMAENLSHDNGCSSVTWVNDSDEGWCGYYDNDESTYSDYGMLYQWSAAMNGTTTEGAQGICPDGWHIPTEAEWTILTDWLGANGHSGTEGTALKATDSNDPAWDGTDDLGFTALPTGYHYAGGGFYLLGSSTSFWSSSEYSVGNVWKRMLSSNGSLVGRVGSSFDYGFSVRCLRTE